MHVFRPVRWVLFALIFSIVSASASAGIYISSQFAPPPLPVYEQPSCPEANLLWMPGYWALGDDGYFWVPGAWAPVPYAGALWTPGYWAWEQGQYVFHDGYWGDHVGYYGGLNYGFGYMGIGFTGGEWRGGTFFYNTAAAHINFWKVHSIFRDRELVDRYTLVRDSHVAFNGGPDGIQYEASREERMYQLERHTERTDFQYQHEFAARYDHDSYFRVNGGHPHTTALERLLMPDTRHEQEIRREMDLRHEQYAHHEQEIQHAQGRRDAPDMHNMPERHDERDLHHQQNQQRPGEQGHPQQEQPGANSHQAGYQGYGTAPQGRDSQQQHPTGQQPPAAQSHPASQQPAAPQAQHPTPSQPAAPQAQHPAQQPTAPQPHVAPQQKPAATQQKPASKPVDKDK